MDIHHGGLIDDDGICVQRILLISLKMHADRTLVPGHAGNFQQAVYRPGLIAGSLGHSLCRPSCRRSQKNLHLLTLKIPDNGIDRRGLSGSGSSRNDKKAAVYRLHHRLNLFFFQLDRLFLLNLKQLFPDCLFWLPASDI